MRPYLENLARVFLLALGLVCAHKIADWRMENIYSTDCHINLREIGLGVRQYLQDYDDKYPPVGLHPDNVGDGWADLLQPYMKGFTFFVCPREPTSATAPKPSEWRCTDYWMNCNLSSVSALKVRTPDLTLLMGEGIGAPTADYAITSFPSTWFNDSTSPMCRHLGGTNYSFTDGHVEWLRPWKVEHFGNRANPFALR